MEKITISKQIELVQNAYHKANDALLAYNEFVRLARTDIPSVRKDIFAAMAKLTTTCEALVHERDAIRAKFANAPMVQATVSYGGKSVKIACARPHDNIDYPSISEATCEAVRHRLGVPDGEKPLSLDGDIAVVSRRGEVVAYIDGKMV